MEGRYLLLVFIISAYLAFLGYYVATPLPITYDPAMHSEIADPIIATQLYPGTWEPLADTGFSYPPLLHWTAFLISLAGIEPIVAVIFLGVLLYAIFPVLLYRVGSIWDRKIGILAALIGSLTPNWSFVFIAGEYPQLLGMDLALVFLYFYLKKEPFRAGLSLGFCALSHPFVPVYLVLFMIGHSVINLFRRDSGTLITAVRIFSIALLVASIWLPKYAAIVHNSTTHQWRNVRWYYEPGFVGFDEVNSFFGNFGAGGRFNPVVTLFAFAAIPLMGFRKRKEFALLLLFLFTLAFSLYHIPSTQYKFPDTLSLILPILSSMGIVYFVGKLNRKYLAKTVAVFFIILFVYMGYTTAIHDMGSKGYVQKAVTTPEAYEAARWLRDYDYEYSRTIKTGEDGVWFSVSSHKYAMDPQITDLEVLTEKTLEQMGDRDKIIERIEKEEPINDLINKHEIKYVVTEDVKTIHSGGNLIYDQDNIRIYEF